MRATPEQIRETEEKEVLLGACGFTWCGPKDEWHLIVDGMRLCSLAESLVAELSLADLQARLRNIYVILCRRERTTEKATRKICNGPMRKGLL